MNSYLANKTWFHEKNLDTEQIAILARVIYHKKVVGYVVTANTDFYLDTCRTVYTKRYGWKQVCYNRLCRKYSIEIITKHELIGLSRKYKANNTKIFYNFTLTSNGVIRLNKDQNEHEQVVDVDLFNSYNEYQYKYKTSNNKLSEAARYVFTEGIDYFGNYVDSNYFPDVHYSEVSLNDIKINIT